MRHPTRAVALAAAVASVAATAAMLSPAPVEAAGPVLPTLATGTITFPAGTASGQVLAFAQPNQATINKDTTSAPLATPLIASANAAADGSFTLTVDPSQVPANDIRDGVINIDLTAVSGGVSQEFFFPVQLAATPTGKAFVSTAAGPKKATPHIAFNMRSGAVVNTKNNPLKWVGENGRTLKLAAAKTVSSTSSVAPVTHRLARIATAVASDATDPVDAVPQCYIVPGDKSYGHPEHFMNVYTDNNDTTSAHVSEGSSSDHTLGVAVRFAGQSWSAGGTSSISRSASTSATSANRQKAWSYWNKVNYQVMSNSCTGRQSNGPIGFYDILAGDLDGPTDMYWTVASCGVKLKGDTWDTGSASSVTFGGGVDLGPLNVSAQSGFGSSENVHFLFLRKGEIAGSSTAGPVNSSKIEADMFWSGC